MILLWFSRPSLFLALEEADVTDQQLTLRWFWGKSSLYCTFLQFCCFRTEKRIVILATVMGNGLWSEGVETRLQQPWIVRAVWAGGLSGGREGDRIGDLF